jgi:hypothetical protein
MKIMKIEYRACLESLGRDAVEEDLQKWLGYVVGKLREKYPEADIQTGISDFAYGSQLFVSCEDKRDDEEAKAEVRNLIREMRNAAWEEEPSL